MLVLIRLLHFLIVVGFFYFPFSENDTCLLLHAIGVPSLLLHWAMNDDTCALTLLEAKWTGHDKKDTFFDMLFGELYRIPRSLQHGVIPYLLAISLWTYTMVRIYQRRTLRTVFLLEPQNGQKSE